MNGAESKKDALIRISQFVIRKESEVLAKDCQDGLIKSILFNSENVGLSIPEMVAEIEKQMGLKNFPISIIQSSIERLDKEKEVLYEQSGKYFLENEEFEKIKDIIAKRKKVLNSFESAIIAKVQEKLPEPKADAANVTLQVLYEFLVNMFTSESNFVSNLLLSKKKFEAPSFPTQILEEALKKLSDADLREAIRSSIRELLEAPESTLASFFYEVVQNYVHLELLNIDPECRSLQKIAFSNKTLILDTNVLMALLLVDVPAHMATNEIISLSRHLGINLVFTKMTKQEWLSVLEKSNEDFQTIRSTRPSLLKELGDYFIQSHLKENAVNPTLTWEGFYMRMRQIESLAAEKSVKFWYKKEYDLDKLPNKELFEPVSGRTYYCAKIKQNLKSKDVCAHDSYHLLLVRKLRNENPPDMLGPACWFLTYDTSLLCVDEGINQFIKSPFDPPSSFVADMWISVIAPFLGPEVSESRLAETLANLMKTHFATMPAGFSASKIVEILGHWLPYKSLSDEDIEAILGDALVINYYNELKEARIKDPRRVRELEEKLREKVDSEVYGIFDERLADATLEREKAEKLALARERELLVEKREKKFILRFCAIIGGISAFLGLIFLAYSNLTSGVPLTIFGMAFIVLALAFKYFKIKMGPIEIEAEQ